MPANKQTSVDADVKTAGKTFIGLVFIDALFLFVVALLSIIFHGDEDESLYYEAGLCLFATIAFFYFAFDAVWRENQFQLAVSVFVHVIILCYVVWHYKWPNLGQVFQQFSLALVIITSIFTAIYLFIFRAVADSFGWRAHRRVGANLVLHDLYADAECFFSFLKLDLLMGCLLLLLTIFYLLSELEDFITFSLAMCITFMWAGLGVYMIRRESKRFLWIFYIFSILEPMYIGYKLWDLHVNKNDYNADVSFGEFASTGAFAIFVRIGLIYMAHVSQKNFGKGLIDVWNGVTVAKHTVTILADNSDMGLEAARAQQISQQQHHQASSMSRPLLESEDRSGDGSRDDIDGREEEEEGPPEPLFGSMDSSS